MSARKVLIVDDNALNVELVSMVLAAASMEVSAVGDAYEATQRIRAFGPDLILMDMQLPGMDGLALTRLLKSEPHFRHIPIVALTAYAMHGDEQKMLQAGCDGYLAKPIDVATFASRIKAFMHS